LTFGLSFFLGDMKIYMYLSFFAAMLMYFSEKDIKK